MVELSSGVRTQCASRARLAFFQPTTSRCQASVELNEDLCHIWYNDELNRARDDATSQ